MKKVLLLLSVIGLAGCGSYTLKNNWEKNVKAGETVVQPGECSELSYALFGLFGVFPITITNESNGDLPKASKDESYGASHYVVTKEGEVKPSDEACEVGPGKPPADEKPEEDTLSESPDSEQPEEAQWGHLDEEDAEEGDIYWENLQETEKANQQGEKGAQQQDENTNQQREEGAQQQDENTNQGG